MRRIMKFRPLWSFQLEKTETWLQKMKEEGYELDSILPFLCIFFFFPTEKSSRSYRILYKTPQLPNRMLDIGWKLKQIASNWFVATIDTSSPMYYPSEEKSLKRLSMYTIVLSIVFIIALISYVTFVVMSDFDDETETIHFFIYAILSILFILFLYFYTLLEKRNFNGIYKKEENVNEDDMFFKPSWMNHHKKTENYLNMMDSKGLKLIKVKGIIFFFKQKKNQNTRTAYKVTFNFNVRKSYFSIYQEAGWRVKHSSGILFNTTIWAKEYEGENVPVFFDFMEDELKAVNMQIYSLVGKILVITIPLFVLYAVFDYWETSRWFSTWEVYFRILPAFLLVWLLMGRAIINLLKYKKSIKKLKDFKPLKNWTYLLVSIVIFIAIVLSESIYNYATPYEFKSQLEVTNVWVTIDKKEKIELSSKTVEDLVKNISLRKLEQGQKAEELVYIQLFFEESGKNYLFHGGGKSPYYLAYWSNNTYRQYYVENGKQLHEELLEIINQ